MYSLLLLSGVEHHGIIEFYVWPLDTRCLCFESEDGVVAIEELEQISRLEKVD